MGWTSRRRTGPPSGVQAIFERNGTPREAMLDSVVNRVAALLDE